MRFPFFFWWTVLAKGIFDGRRGLPGKTHFSRHPLAPNGGEPADADTYSRLSFYEQELAFLADLSTDKICRKWKGIKERLDGRLKAVRWELASLIETAHQLHHAHRTHQFREAHVAVGKAAYLGLMSLAGLAEAAFAVAALRILRVSKPETYLIALGPSIFTLAAAHLLGQMIAQAPLPGERRSARWIAGGAAIVCLITALTAMSILRQEFLTYSGKAASYGTVIALICLNILFFAGGTILSRMSHHHDAELERICAQRRKLIGKIKRVWGRWNSLSSRFDSARADTREATQIARDEAKARIAEYRRGVAMGVAGAEIPIWFNDSITDRLFAARPELDVELDGAPPPLDELLLPLTTPAVISMNGNGKHVGPAPSNTNRRDRLGIPALLPTSERPVNGDLQ